MSGAFPTSKKPRVFNFASNRPNTTTYTLSGKRSVKQFAAQYFSFSVQMPPMIQADFQAFHAFLVKQKGSFDTFTFQYPLENQGADKAQTDILVNGTAAIGATQVPLQAALVNNEAVTVNQPSFTVALAQDDVLYSTDPAGLFSLAFDVREVL